jgi:LuxR family transcriptional regulator, quorum-sensing system regulator CviR
MKLAESAVINSAEIVVDQRVNSPAAESVVAPAKERRHAEFFDVVNSSLAIDSPEQFCKWTQGDLQHIFPHEMLVCGIGLIENFSANIQHLISCNFPAEYIHTLHQKGGLNSSPVMLQWIRSRKPVLYEMTAQCSNSTWLENFKRHGLNNIAAHGQSDVNSQTTSYFSFSRIPGKLMPRHASLLEMLIPHLHVALIRAIKGIKEERPAALPALPCLTKREQEVLQWLGSGKSNWEIAQVLHISENTVRNHVQRILLKLKVSTRTQAVAKGLVKK